MNNELQQKLSQLENLMAIQTECVLNDQYMHGMLNGMILAHSIFDNSRPQYKTLTKRRKMRSVRHKSLIIKKGGRR
jgi:hypothetical protein